MKKRLTYQLVTRIIMLSTFLATIATAIQLYFDFRYDAGAIKQSVNEISNIHTVTLSEAIWTFNRDLALAELNALLGLQGIEYMEVVDTEVSGLRVGVETLEHLELTEVPLNYFSNDESHNLGILKIGSSFESVYDRLIDKFLLVLSTNALKLFAVSIFILLLLKSLVTDPVKRLTDHIRRMDFDGSMPRENSSGGMMAPANEIEEIEQVILALESDLRKSYSSLKRANEEKVKVYRATVKGTQHIINNSLNQLQLVKFKMQQYPEFDRKTIETFDSIVKETKQLIVKLSSVEEIDEENITGSFFPK